jgi:predicted nucleotidyltransferase
MTKEQIIKILKEKSNIIKNQFSVSKIGLFGSYAKDKQTPKSDIDFYVEFEKKSFDNLSGLWVFLEELYHKKIDIIYKHKNSNSVMLNRIEQEVIYG